MIGIVSGHRNAHRVPHTRGIRHGTGRISGEPAIGEGVDLTETLVFHRFQDSCESAASDHVKRALSLRQPKR